MKQPRPIRIEGDVAYVPLTQGYEAVIDASDVPFVQGHNWFARKAWKRNGELRTVYAMRNSARERGRQRTIMMHKVLLGVERSVEVDLRDGDGLNNRRGNLRPATRAQNQHNRRLGVDNTSGFKGVYWDRNAQRWRAQICASGHQKHLGCFDSREAAASAYASASAKLHGEFGRTA